jgi:hypothetical protein
MCKKTSISFATAHASQKQDKARKKDRTVQRKKKEKERQVFEQKKKKEKKEK